MPRTQWAGRTFRSFGNPCPNKTRATFSNAGQGSTSVTVPAVAAGGILLLQVGQAFGSATTSVGGTLSGTWNKLTEVHVDPVGGSYLNCELWVCTDYGTTGGNAVPSPASEMGMCTYVSTANGKTGLNTIRQYTTNRAVAGVSDPTATLPGGVCYEVFAAVNQNGGSGAGTVNNGGTMLQQHSPYTAETAMYDTTDASQSYTFSINGLKAQWAMIILELS